MVKCPCEHASCEFWVREKNCCKIVRWRGTRLPESFSGTTARLREKGQPDVWIPKCPDAVKNGLCKFVDKHGNARE